MKEKCEQRPDIGCWWQAEKLNIDVKKSKPEKIREILESGKNPYFLKYKGITIKIGFASTNRTIEEAIESLVQMKW